MAREERIAPQMVSLPAEVPTTDGSVRAQLKRILETPAFEATQRSRDFLAYVVDETLAGRADRIKAFTIATDVFGRNSNFDAHGDPIVRLEAGRLRRALDQYYAAAGHEDLVRISIPKGGYVPLFEPNVTFRPPAEATRLPSRRRFVPLTLAATLAAAAAVTFGLLTLFAAAPPVGPAIPRLMVRPFEDLTGSGASRVVVKGLTQEIIGQLAKFKDIVTVEDDGSAKPIARNARYILAGGVSVAADKLRLQARVSDAEDSAVLWAQTYETAFEPSQIIAVESEIARQVATALGQPYGIIFKADASRSMQATTGDWSAYSCTLSYFAYRANLDAKSHPNVRKCLEDAVARFPNYATAWALLAQTYIDEMRFGYPVDASTSPASLERAIAAANRAIDLDPQNVRALQAKMLTLYFDGQLDAALNVGKRASATNPNDTELMGEYGSRLADSGQWNEGCELIAEALDRNPGPSGYYETILSICAYVRKDYKEAATLVRKAAVMDNPAYHLIAAAIFAEAGLADEAATQRRWLMTHAPEFATNVRSWAGLKNVQPADRDRFLASLRKAELPIPP
ncbi:hypothetical protein ACMDCR_07600 [Labrys okinawensis]|uniref:hypothetical protein n=1 Tax=Labrys okinawensis TaxID=346911 RepID=UPI0039BD7440